MKFTTHQNTTTCGAFCGVLTLAKFTTYLSLSGMRAGGAEQVTSLAVGSTVNRPTDPRDTQDENVKIVDSKPYE